MKKNHVQKEECTLYNYFENHEQIIIVNLGEKCQFFSSVF